MAVAQDFEKGKCQVVAIAINQFQESGLKWLETTNSPFSLFLNPSTLLFLHLGIRRQFKTVITIPIIMGFVEKRIAGITGPSLYKGDDLLMMGTDIIVDQEGKLVYVFHQELYTDRPHVEDFLQVIKDTEK